MYHPFPVFSFANLRGNGMHASLKLSVNPVAVLTKQVKA